MSNEYKAEVKEVLSDPENMKVLIYLILFTFTIVLIHLFPMIVFGIAFVKESIDQSKLSELPNWNINTDYTKNQIVKYNDFTIKSLQEHTSSINNSPISQTDGYWEPVKLTDRRLVSQPVMVTIILFTSIRLAMNIYFEKGTLLNVSLYFISIMLQILILANEDNKMYMYLIEFIIVTFSFMRLIPRW